MTNLDQRMAIRARHRRKMRRIATAQTVLTGIAFVIAFLMIMAALIFLVPAGIWN